MVVLKGILERIAFIFMGIFAVLFVIFMFLLTAFIGALYAIVGWEIDLFSYIIVGKAYVYKGVRYMVHNFVDIYG